MTYSGSQPAKEYPGFRRSIEDLCQSPTFQGERVDRIRAMLSPFDAHFEGWETATMLDESEARVLMPNATRDALG